MKKYRELTKDERNALPRELKACWWICGWNTFANIKTLDDWVNTFWAILLSDEDAYEQKTEAECKRELKAKVEKLLEFAKWIEH